MATTTANRIAAEAKQACLDLGLSPELPSVRRVLKTGKSAIKSMSNYYNRRPITDIELKPYTNEFGEQEPFGEICDRNLEYAEVFVEKNMAKFEGGIRNMTKASTLVMRKQRQKIEELTNKNTSN